MAPSEPTKHDRPSGDKPRVRRIGSLINQLMSRRGYAQVLAGEDLHQVVASVVGQQLGNSLQVGNLRGGVLQIYAADSVTLQELNFRKRAILKQLRSELQEHRVTDLRFRIQS